MTKQLIAKVYTKFFRNEVNVIIDFRERSEIIEKTLKLLSKDKLTDIQKKSIYKIVMNYNDCGDIHKVRFNLYYGLDPNYNTRLSIAEISKILKISTSSVRGSINMFGYKLNYINESEIYVFQKILDEYYENIGIPRVNYNHSTRVMIIDKLLEISKQNLLNAKQKEIVRNFVNCLNNRTENQKNRFIMFYNLIDSDKKTRLCDIARQSNRSVSAIRCSIMRVRTALIRMENEDIFILKTILDECIKEYDIKFIEK